MTMAILAGLLLATVLVGWWFRGGEAKTDPPSRRTVALVRGVADMAPADEDEDERESAELSAAPGRGALLRLRRTFVSSASGPVGSPGFEHPFWELNWEASTGAVCVRVCAGPEPSSFLVWAVTLRGGPADPESVQRLAELLRAAFGDDVTWHRRQDVVRGDLARGSATPKEDA